ncbi:MAG: LppX_LprAFG lipoprotein [Candidatus Dormibacteria bacterium]
MSPFGGPMRAGLVGLLAVVMLSACGPTPEDPARALTDGANAMAALHSVSADVSFGAGAAAFGFDLNSASARLKLPSDSESTIKARRGDAVFEFGIITLSGHEYLRAPLVGWSELTPGQASSLPDFSRLLDHSKGFPAVLGLGTGARNDGTEDVDGKACQKVRATYTAEQVAQVITVLSPTGPVDAVAWIDTRDHRVRRVRLSGALFSAGKQSTIEVHLHDFDASVDIRKPI